MDEQEKKWARIGCISWAVCVLGGLLLGLAWAKYFWH